MTEAVLKKSFEDRLFSRPPEIDEWAQDWQSKNARLVEGWEKHGTSAVCASVKQNQPCDLCYHLYGDPYYMRTLTNWVNRYPVTDA